MSKPFLYNIEKKIWYLFLLLFGIEYWKNLFYEIELNFE